MERILTEEKNIYIQIKEMIEKQILRGELLEGEQVPSTNMLAKQYSINPNTAGKGIKMLTEEGVLYKEGELECLLLREQSRILFEKERGNFITVM